MLLCVSAACLLSAMLQTIEYIVKVTEEVKGKGAKPSSLNIAVSRTTD